MDVHRAEEITRSFGYIDVLYKDLPVWIEEINVKEGTVKVKELDSDKQYAVLVSKLHEK